jgi:hypothetical protein
MRRLSRFRQGLTCTQAMAQRSRGLPLIARLVPLWIHTAGRRRVYLIRACGVDADPALNHDRRACHLQGAMVIREREKGLWKEMKERVLERCLNCQWRRIFLLYINECTLDILKGSS